MQKSPQLGRRRSDNVALQGSMSADSICDLRGFTHDAGNSSVKGKVVDIECDGSKTLLEQQAAINYAEQTKSLQLVCYQKSAAPKNSASVKLVPKAQTILPLLLIELPASTAAGSEVATQLAAGRHLVFYSVVYVKGVETKVAGFR